MPLSATSDNIELYLLIKNMQINRANAMPCPYLTGLPSMYGLVGMGRNLVNHALQGSGLHFESIALCISSFHMSGSQKKYPGFSLQDMDRHQDVRVITARDSWFDASILVRVTVKNKEKVNTVRSWIEENKHLDELYSLKLCGGAVMYSSREPNITLLRAEEVKDVCQHLDGYFIADRIELCRSERLPEEDALDTLLRLIQNSKESGHGWLTPLNVGFISLGQPERRKNTRQFIGHSFAEPVLGLGRLFSACSVARSVCTSEPFFWKPFSKKFVVAGSI
ncbi:type I-F CRISPR-associated protein Csy2 [Endozoicomonas lisbonensis]|uniref:CRISPR-associated protein Csy2 n=1 Tax=Endozoicomonas lisbonensis TaxID=3120522 RepID=A0ABV2SD83_9GAMM